MATNLPGHAPVDGQEFLYVEYSGPTAFGTVFWEIGRGCNPFRTQWRNPGRRRDLDTFLKARSYTQFLLEVILMAGVACVIAWCKNRVFAGENCR